MSRHDDAISMQHMLDYAQKAVTMTHGRTRAELESDYMFQLALTRLVESIGEAASRVSESTRKRYADIPWPDVVGMRNRLIHGYHVVDLNLLWDTVATDLLPLMAALEEALAED